MSAQKTTPMMITSKTIEPITIKPFSGSFLEMIEKQIDNSTSYREFSCLIMSATKDSLKELSDSFRNDLGFETELPVYQHEMWTTRVTKQILFSELKDSLKIVREASAKFSGQIFDWMIGTDKEQNPEEPEMVIINTLNDAGIDEVDNKTFVELEKHLDDLSRSREFDCLFMSETKTIARKLSAKFRNNLGYNTENPYHDEDGWITHAVKQILYSDIKDTLKTAREEATSHTSKLFDWMIEVDKSS